MFFPDSFNNSLYELLQSLRKKRSTRFCKFSTLFKDLADDIDQTRGQELKFDKKKLFIKTSFSSKSNKYFNLTRALSSLETNLQILLIFKLKLSWSSTCIPINLTDKVNSTTLFPGKNFRFRFACLITFLIIIDLNLSGLTMILFSENHLIEF